MPSLCVVMIARDEAACLAECLGSVRDVADHLVVGDTGSTDNTPSIAREFGAQVIEVPWTEDFAAARNAVLAVAPGDWLLHLDADEFLDPENAHGLRSLVDADGAGCDALELTLANYCDDPRAFRWVPAGKSPYARGRTGYLAVPLLRLFRNGRGYHYREPVHENITASVADAGGRIGRADLVIHHHGYDPDPETRVRKARRYLAIAARKAGEMPGDAKAQHDYAEQLLALDRAAEAETACRAALAADPGYLPAAMSLANLLLNRGALAEAEAVLVPLEEAGTLPAHGRVALAAIDLREGELRAARHRLDAVLTADHHHVLAHLYRARLHDLRGDYLAAQADLVAAHAVADLPEVRARLSAHTGRTAAHSLLAAHDPAGALARLVAALREDPEDPLIHWRIGEALEALGLEDKAQESYLRARRLAPSLGQ